MLTCKWTLSSVSSNSALRTPVISILINKQKPAQWCGSLGPDLREPEIHWLHGKPLKYWPSNPYRLNRYQTKADGFRCRTRISDWPATDEQKMISVHARSITSLGVGTHRARGKSLPAPPVMKYWDMITMQAGVIKQSLQQVSQSDKRST